MEVGERVVALVRAVVRRQAGEHAQRGRPPYVLSHPIEDVNNCLNTDRTTIRTTNLKGEVQLFKGNKLSLFNLFSLKEAHASPGERLRGEMGLGKLGGRAVGVLMKRTIYTRCASGAVQALLP